MGGSLLVENSLGSKVGFRGAVGSLVNVFLEFRGFFHSTSNNLFGDGLVSFHDDFTDFLNQIEFVVSLGGISLVGGNKF